MQIESNYNPTAVGVLQVDISQKLFGSNSSVQKIMKPVSYQDLMDYQNKRYIKGEFNLIREITNTDHHNAQLVTYDPVAFKMNRYPDIIPYQHSLVKINDGILDQNDSQNYINANYIKNPYHVSEPIFIATQGPTPLSFNNFWRMTWSENISKIVMLCGLNVEGKIKCDIYFPDEVLSQKKIRIGNDFVVELTNIDKSNSFFWIRTFKLLNLKSNQTKIVHQYHTVAWPDRGIPAYSEKENLEKMILKISEHIKLTGEKVIVHCSAGVGRTGTFIALYFLFQLARRYKRDGLGASNPGWSIFGTVRALREQRLIMVQTEIQYDFIHQRLRSYVHKLFK